MPKSTRDQLEDLFPGRIATPVVVEDIPRKQWLVYILTYDDKPITVGHGKVNRARVIFDDRTQVTKNHLKALFVRIYRLYGTGEFQQFIIVCADKAEAKCVEKKLHSAIGGNNRSLPATLEASLFHGLLPGTIPYMVLKMALCSSFDGLADLRLWHRKGILGGTVWTTLSNKLALSDE